MKKLLIITLILAVSLAPDRLLKAQNPSGTFTLDKIQAMNKSLEIRYLDNQREYQQMLWELEQEATINNANAEKTTSEIFIKMIREKMKLLEKQMERAKGMKNVRAYKLAKKRKVLTRPRP